MHVLRSSALLMFATLATGFAPQVIAQTQLPSVVQLPSLRTFFYSGTVVVPDSGSAYLGGNRSAASGSSRRGFWGRGHGFGTSLGNPQASVSATIIDHHEIDRQLLGGTPQQFLDRDKAEAKAKTLDPAEEGKALVRFARQQYREGNKTASFDTYRMAIGVLQGRLRELATVEFRRVFGTAADQSLRMASLHR